MLSDNHPLHSEKIICKNYMSAGTWDIGIGYQPRRDGSLVLFSSVAQECDGGTELQEMEFHFKIVL